MVAEGTINRKIFDIEKKMREIEIKRTTIFF